MKSPIEVAREICDHAQLNHGMTPYLRKHLELNIAAAIQAERDVNAKLERKVEVAVKALEQVARTDISDSCGVVWLTAWRNETKLLAQQALKSINNKELEGV